MSSPNAATRRLPISPHFFCDGACYLLTSASLGGSHLTPNQLSTTILGGVPNEIESLLRQGVCIPLFFDGDCALDRATVVVVGDLTPQEQQEWVGRLVWKLNIPCGKFVILCGGGYADDLAHAISGDPPSEHYEIFQVFEMPPGEYQVEIYAYSSSLTAYQHRFSRLGVDDSDALDDEVGDDNYDPQGQIKTASYIIRLTPLKGDLPLPALDENGWCAAFEFRELNKE
jgi:hypothetical protein